MHRIKIFIPHQIISSRKTFLKNIIFPGFFKIRVYKNKIGAALALVLSLGFLWTAPVLAENMENHSENFEYSEEHFSEIELEYLRISRPPSPAQLSAKALLFQFPQKLERSPLDQTHFSASEEKAETQVHNSNQSEKFIRQDLKNNNQLFTANNLLIFGILLLIITVVLIAWFLRFEKKLITETNNKFQQSKHHHFPLKSFSLNLPKSGNME